MWTRRALVFFALLAPSTALPSRNASACGDGVRTEVRAAARSATIITGRSVTLVHGAVEHFEILRGTAVVSLSREGNRLVARARRTGQATVLVRLANAREQRWHIRVGSGPSRCREPGAF